MHSQVLKYSLSRFIIKSGANKSYNRVFFNLLAFLIVAVLLIMGVVGTDQMIEPISSLQYEVISLSPINLFSYSLQTTLRMLVAVIFSLIFSLIYAALAAKNARLEKFLIPLLDILQSVPILGYISFTVTGFLVLFPNSTAGPQMAAIFAIFTSQAWNITFSFYQSLKTIPEELIEASYIFKMSSWQRFWRLEIPYGIPGLVWNIVISMAGGWFFIVAAEVITVGNNNIILPGVGSYIALALKQQNIPAIFYAIITMILTIFLYNQLLLKTLIVWSDKFHYDITSGSGSPPKSWVIELFSKSSIIKHLFKPVSSFAKFIIYLPIFSTGSSRLESQKATSPTIDYLWYGFLVIIALIISYYLFNFLHQEITLAEIGKVLKLGFITLLKIVVLISLISLIWTPIGIYVGLRPKLAAIIQPIAQFLAALPANLLFPMWVIAISYYNLDPDIWLSPLIIISSQWYILFNVIAGSAALPNELREVTANLNIKGWLWLRKVMLPAITPYFITGVITAIGGAWNASIIAEVVNYGDKKLVATGLGSYIAEMTEAADFPRIVLGVGIMALFVVVFNHFFWQPLHEYADKKFRL